MWVVVVWRSMRSTMSLVLMLNYLDDIINCVGEADFVVIASVIPSSSWTRRSSEKHLLFFCTYAGVNVLT